MRPGDRAWPVRGLTSAPWFGRTMPDSWMGHTVRLLRPQMVASHGGYSESGAPSEYLSAKAHVWWGSNGEPSGPYDLGIGVVVRKVIRFVMAIPADPDHIPRKGDRVKWTDDLGQTYEVNVRNVHSPMGLADHLEVETEAWR